MGNIAITCLKAIPTLLKNYPDASFGFSGVRTYDKLSKKIEDYRLTQRYRVYKEVLPMKITGETFEHKTYDDISSYMLINRRYGDVEQKEEELKKILSATYENLLNEF